MTKSSSRVTNRFGDGSKEASIGREKNGDNAYIFISPRFKSAAAMAGWDEEDLIIASFVVDDTPERSSSKRRRRSHLLSKTTPPSSEDVKPKEELEQYIQYHKRVMIDSLWKLNVADIEATLSHVCQLFHQDHEAKREELRARARGFKTLGRIFQRAKTASESDTLAKTEHQKLNGNERKYDDACSSPKSNETSHSNSGPQEPQSPYVEEFKLGDQQLNYYFTRPAPPRL